MLAGDRSRSVGSYPTTNLPIMPVPGSVVVCAGMSFVLLLIFSTTNETEITEGVEGPGSAEEMLTVLQRVLEESAPVLVTARHDAEERRTNIRLREEDDAAYRAALEADQETITLSKQLAYYKEYQKKLVGIDGKANASSTISGSVNLISSGSSDFVQRSYINPLLYKNYTPDQISDILIQSYATFVQELYGLGARKIGVATLPPLGCLPASITIFGSDSNECVTKLNKVAMSFNNKLNVTSRNSLNKLSNLASQNLRRVLEESAPVLVTARHEAEERRTNICLSEEQNAAYRAAALEADQARERLLKEEQEQLAREAGEAERKRKEDEEAREREARESAEKEAALASLRQEKALSLGAEPEKGPDITRVLVRFPTGERKDRRFRNAATIQSLYDYVDSLGCLEVESCSIASNFPRIVYGPDELSMSQKEAGLHTQASLFVELSS